MVPAPRTGRKISIVAAYEGGRVPHPHIDKLVPELLDRRYKVRFYGWDRRRLWPSSTQEGKRGVEYVMLLRGGMYGSRWLMLWYPIWYVFATVRLIGRDDELRMGLSFEGGLPCALASLVDGVPYVYNCRDNVEYRGGYPRVLVPLLRLVERFVVRRAVKVIFPDEIRIGPDVPHSKVILARNCAPDVPVGPLDPDRRELVVYAMGYLRRDRGIELLLDAAESVDHVRVVVAGECRDEMLLARLRASDRCEYLGPLEVEDALKQMNNVDVVFTFYAPTTEINRRAVSNKWSDAMMARRPILVNREVLKSQWVVDHNYGFRCAYDLTDLKRTLQRLRDDRDALARAGQDGRLEWERGYNWPAAAKVLLEGLDDAFRRMVVSRRA